MDFFFLFVALIIAIVDWIAVSINWRNVEYFAKPAVMIFLLIWLGQTSRFEGHLIWFALGLAFSLAGDVFLMLPRERFMAGLVSFLLGHLAYLVGFNSTLPRINLPMLILALLMAGTTLQIYRRIAAGLMSSGNEHLRLPLLIYSIVISLMLLSALLTLVRPEWQPLQSLFVTSGALLFFLSDTVLAWNRFVAPLPKGRIMVIITYHLGQLLITLGAATHFISL